MAPILRHVLLFAALLSPSFAVPTSEPHIPSFDPQVVSRLSNSKTPFQRFRDSIIERIWSVPKKSDCHDTLMRSDHAAPANFRAKYGRDVALRFQIENAEEAKAFSEAANVLYLDVWDHSSEWVDVRIAQDVLPSFLNLLPASMRNSYTPLMHDLAQAVYETYPASGKETWRARHNSVQEKQHDLFFHDYQPLSVLYPWLNLMASLFPHHVQSFSIGKSAEGRDIPAIRVSAPINEQVPDDQVQGRQTILVIGGSHAREWISTSTVAYMIYNFATQYGQSHAYMTTQILKHYDVIFIPVLNPDGYEYTWGTDRFWRKNRQSTSLPFCPGIDLNRAFGSHWDGHNETDNPCMESYAGEHAFQAVEAQVLAEWARNQTVERSTVFTALLDLHSYSQKVLYPFSYSCDDEPHNLEDLEEVAIGLSKSFRLATGHLYEVLSACESQFQFQSKSDKDGKKLKPQFPGVNNNNGGSILDYFYDDVRVRWSYQIKLRDTGTYGFLLPRQHIIPSGREAHEGLVGLGRYLLSNRGVETLDEDQSNMVEDSMNISEENKKIEEWRNRSPDLLFRVPGVQSSIVDPVTEDDNDDDEWERVYDEELRRRRR